MLQYFFIKKFNKYKDIPSKVKKYTIPLLEILNRSSIKKFNTLIAIAKKKIYLIVLLNSTRYPLLKKIVTIGTKIKYKKVEKV